MCMPMTVARLVVPTDMGKVSVKSVCKPGELCVLLALLDEKEYAHVTKTST